MKGSDLGGGVFSFDVVKFLRKKIVENVFDDNTVLQCINKTLEIGGEGIKKAKEIYK